MTLERGTVRAEFGAEGVCGGSRKSITRRLNVARRGDFTRVIWPILSEGGRSSVFDERSDSSDRSLDRDDPLSTVQRPTSAQQRNLPRSLPTGLRTHPTQH